MKWSVEDDNPLLREEAAKGLIGKEGLEGPSGYRASCTSQSPVYVSNAAETLSWTNLCQAVSTVEKPNDRLVKALVNAIHTVQLKVVPYEVAYDTGLVTKVNPSGAATYGRAYGVDKGMVRVKTPVPQPRVVSC